MTPTEKFEAKYRRPKEGRTLIVGSRVYATREDRRKLYADAVGVDMLDGPGVDIVANLEEPIGAFPAGGPQGFDHVECISVLEHSRRPWLLADNIQSLMAPGATIHLSVPFIWRLHAYPSDYWRFTVEAVRELFPLIEWDALRYASQDALWKSDSKQPRQMIGDTVYFPRTEVLGFGRLA